MCNHKRIRQKYIFFTYFLFQKLAVKSETRTTLANRAQAQFLPLQARGWCPEAQRSPGRQPQPQPQLRL